MTEQVQLALVTGAVTVLLAAIAQLRASHAAQWRREDLETREHRAHP